jgi:heme-degrading monooxygenase HmoA
VHARLSTYAGPAEGLDEMVRGFDEVTDRLRQLDGFQGGYVLVDRATGKAATITLWISENDAQASAQQADEMRGQVAQAGSHSIESVETYEVALQVQGG